MRRTAYTLFALMFLPLTANASELTRCVQNQLLSLGYEIGQADGIIGPNTIKASKTLVEGEADTRALESLPPLSETTADVWCAQLAQAFPQLTKHQPRESEHPVKTSSVAGNVALDLVEKLYIDVLSFYQNGWELQISSPIFVFASEDPKFLSRNVSSHLESAGFGVPNGTRNRIRWVCENGNLVSGITYYNALALCWKSPNASYQSNYDQWASELQIELGALLTHEYMHFVQHVLADEKNRNGRTPKGEVLLGPEWLVEGSAEFFELRYWRARQENFSGPNIAALQGIARSSRISIFDIGKPSSVRSLEEYRVALLSVELLAGRAGEQSLFEYWQFLGSGSSRHEAFERAFGVELGEFQESFQQLSTQYTAAQKFIRRID